MHIKLIETIVEMIKIRLKLDYGGSGVRQLYQEKIISCTPKNPIGPKIRFNKNWDITQIRNDKNPDNPAI